MSELPLKSAEFRREREASWRRFAALVARVEKKGIDDLVGKELVELPMLYRGALSSLSVARAISLDRNLLDYLEALCQRGFLVVYGPRRTLREAIRAFFLERFPRTVRRYGRHFAVAVGVTLLGFAVGWALVASSPDWWYALIPAGLAGGRGPAATTEFLRQGLYDQSAPTDWLGAFASGLFAHNARVGMLCFALGFLAGLPVVLMLLQNGVILGAFASLYASRGLTLDLWGWLLPHGVTEILALLLCATAGLVIAERLVFPGRTTRLESLAQGGREAGVIVLGTIFMFLLAGLIEGIFRQVVMDVGVRYLVVLSSAALWLLYFTRMGRPRRRA